MPRSILFTQIDSIGMDIGTSPLLGWWRETVDPGSGRIREFVLNVIICATGPLQHVETVIRSFDQMQRSALREILANGLEQIEPGQLVPGPLQKEQRNPGCPQVITPFDTRLLDRMEGKAEEDDASDIRERRLRRGQGRHSAAHRLTPGKKRKTV
jgi:hypothetical protein